ncbi:MAG: hypothetical protein BJ554DRAFT_6620, partial [Olpidium bornovanus]
RRKGPAEDTCGRHPGRYFCLQNIFIFLAPKAGGGSGNLADSRRRVLPGGAAVPHHPQGPGAERAARRSEAHDHGVLRARARGQGLQPHHRGGDRQEDGDQEVPAHRQARVRRGVHHGNCRPDEPAPLLRGDAGPAAPRAPPGDTRDPAPVNVKVRPPPRAHLAVYAGEGAAAGAGQGGRAEEGGRVPREGRERGPGSAGPAAGLGRAAEEEEEEGPEGAQPAQLQEEKGQAAAAASAAKTAFRQACSAAGKQKYLPAPWHERELPNRFVKTARAKIYRGSL